MLFKVTQSFILVVRNLIFQNSFKNNRILVLDAGEVAEFDTPSELIERGGIFYTMAKDAGLV